MNDDLEISSHDSDIENPGEKDWKRLVDYKTNS